MIADILIPLAAIGLAELGDKTQISILLLSSRTTRHLHLLLGVFLAFLTVDGIAILVGSWITSILPVSWVKLASGVIFIVFGLFTLRSHEEKAESKLRFNSPFLSGFAFVSMMEWGDKTQIASALFAARYDPWMVLIGTMTALTLLSVAAIYLGKLILSRIDRRTMIKVAGTAFVLIGISFFLV